jgi:23S rRNA pseudouridine2605 synthase
MSKKPFEKFINKTATGAKKKEALRQEKRKAKAEARAIGEQFRKKETDRRQTHNYQVTLNAKLNIDKKVEEALKAKPERENSNTEIPNSKVPGSSFCKSDIRHAKNQRSKKLPLMKMNLCL